MTAFPDIRTCPSPSFGERREGQRPDLIVLHYTAMETAEASLERLCDPSVEVSAHYLIAEDGRVWQMVEEAKRAWHAGAGRWRDVTDVNSRSIGIELANRGDHPFPEPQMRALGALMQGIMQRWAIPPQNVIGHSDMAPARKGDPGRRFDWKRLALEGLSVWPKSGTPASAHLDKFPEALALLGYPLSEDGPEACVRAFRERFRPWAHGPVDGHDMRMVLNLVRRFGVDQTSSGA